MEKIFGQSDDQLKCYKFVEKYLKAPAESIFPFFWRVRLEDPVLYSRRRRLQSIVLICKRVRKGRHSGKD